MQKNRKTNKEHPDEPKENPKLDHKQWPDQALQHKIGELDTNILDFNYESDKKTENQPLPQIPPWKTSVEKTYKPWEPKRKPWRTR